MKCTYATLNWIVNQIQIRFLIFFIFQISCQQVIDYDESDPNGGLGESFQPSIKASCVGGKMTIRVDTNIPFEVWTLLITNYKLLLCVFAYAHI